MSLRTFHSTTHNLKQVPRNIKGKSVAKQNWIKRQINDPYVKKAKYESYRCRSAFKLTEIDDKFKIFRPGQIVIDCGASPGSWSQVAVQRVNALGIDESIPKGTVIGVDLQHIMPINGAILLSNSDFTDPETTRKILEKLEGKMANVVISDMAPNSSGIKSMDHDIIINLCTKALTFSSSVLSEGGTYLCKIWQGKHQNSLENLLKQSFESVKQLRPIATRTNSAEAFLLARNFRQITIQQ